MTPLLARIAVALVSLTGALALSGEGSTAGADPPPDPGFLAGAPTQNIANSERIFGAELLTTVADGSSANAAVSPGTVFDVLALLRPGARGATASALDRALHTSLSPQALLAGATALAHDSEGASDDVSVAHAAWLQNGFAVNPDYSSLVIRAGAPPHLVDFVSNPDAARQAVNHWVEDHTAGRIDDLFPAGSIDQLTRLVLASALSFEAHWAIPFSSTSTTEASFNAPDGHHSVPTMHRTGDMQYAEGPTYQAVDLPYSGDRFSALVILPRGGADPSSFASSLDTIVSTLSTTRVDLALPRVAMAVSEDLRAALTALGVGAIFSAGTADLSGIHGRPGDLYVSGVEHKVWLHVDEQGTKAAAASGVQVATSAGQLPRAAVPMVVDHPFLFVIRDRASNLPLLIARVSDPD